MNAALERVWPIDGPVPSFKRGKRRRRKLEADPEPYRVHLPDALALLRKLK